jgi:hypothetical protein
MSLQANPFAPHELVRLREVANRCRCSDCPSCDACRFIATCDYLIDLALRNKAAAEREHPLKGVL